MSEFVEMMKELLLGDEPFPAERAREDLRQALQRFDRRMRLARNMTWIYVTAMLVAGVWAVNAIVSAPEGAGLKSLLIYLIVILVVVQGIGLCKLWFFMEHNNFLVLREIKRLHIEVASLTPSPSPRGRGE